MAFPKTFEEWMAAVEAVIRRIAGVHADDLIDMPYFDWFEDGLTPKRAAVRAIRVENGGDW